MTSELEKKSATWADNQCPDQGPEFIVWCMCQQDFMAGYRLALEWAEEWCKVLVCNECQKEYQGQTICVDCYEHHTGRRKYE